MFRRTGRMTLFNCYRYVQNEKNFYKEFGTEMNELDSEFIAEIAELSQEQIDEMIRSATDEEDDDDVIPF
jgi:hypothetical protein